jgi:hypothetical protein
MRFASDIQGETQNKLLYWSAKIRLVLFSIPSVAGLDVPRLNRGNRVCIGRSIIGPTNTNNRFDNTLYTGTQKQNTRCNERDVRLNHDVTIPSPCVNPSCIERTEAQNLLGAIRHQGRCGGRIMCGGGNTTDSVSEMANISQPSNSLWRICCKAILYSLASFHAKLPIPE